MKLGILPLARATFDVDLAHERLAAMLARLEEDGHEIMGEARLLLDADATRRAMDDLAQSSPQRLLILQLTFTDAAMIVEASRRFSVPLCIWAVPEPRLGGRLRLNAFCGLNLASHALGIEGRRFTWSYADPGQSPPAEFDKLFGLVERPTPPAPVAPRNNDAEGKRVVSAVSGKRIGRIGLHPDGFTTCDYTPDALRELADIDVEPLDLDDMFAKAKEMADISPIRKTVSKTVAGLDAVDHDELDRSLALAMALEELARERDFDAFAVRCWPECFTQYGGAVCGPVAIMGEAGIPCACEADVYGAVTQLILGEVAQAPTFLTDLVDIDPHDGTGVVWHCGQAPLSMCAPDQIPVATIHSNRKMPLLYQFGLKPGRVTFARISQAHGNHKMVISSGEMLDRPIAFTGTSGVFRFDRPAGEVMSDIIEVGLEHHMALAYGEHRASLRGVAAALGLPVLEL